jgi:prepilin-type N-terminal cleavage/methylation domain-containing protein
MLHTKRNTCTGATDARGFTLVELGVVLAVVAIIAGIVVPGYLEISRNRLADRVVEDVKTITKAARLFFLNSARDDVYAARWPGMTTGCAVVPGDSPIAELQRTGYLRNDIALADPWGNPYISSVTAPANGCRLQITTANNSIPTALQPILQARLAQITCTTAPGTCTVSAPRPGFVASYQNRFPCRGTEVPPSVSYCATASRCRARVTFCYGPDLDPTKLVPSNYLLPPPAATQTSTCGVLGAMCTATYEIPAPGAAIANCPGTGACP